MNLKEFLEHHGLRTNPFAEEDAQTDVVFREHCIESTFHPAWDKVIGSPSAPSTSIVFGAKGSGKTAMRLQLDRNLRQYNADHPGERVFVIHYDDFNGWIGQLQTRLGRKLSAKPERVLQKVGIHDHMDALLVQGVTELIDQVLVTTGSTQAAEHAIPRASVDKLDKDQRSDLLLLAACYDQSKIGNTRQRWNDLRRVLHVRNWTSQIDWVVAWVGSIVGVLCVVGLWWNEYLLLTSAILFAIVAVLIASGRYLWRLAMCYSRAWKVVHNCRVRRQSVGEQAAVFLQLPWSTWSSEPMPVDRVSESRYSLLAKLQHILQTLGFPGIIVLVDRVDEPELVNGKPELMRLLIWPMLDNKLLKHPRMGFKLMLPQELQHFVDRETREFHDRARLDKQNVMSNFDWTGESMYDLVSARLLACAIPGRKPVPTDLFDDSIGQQRLIKAMRELRVPRQLFRFLYSVVSEHCKKYTSSEPEFKIQSATFESVFATCQENFRRETTAV